MLQRKRFVSFLCVSLLVCVGLKAQQCSLPNRIFLPTADEVRFERFGAAMDIDNEYLVVGAPDNSSLQVYAGAVSVYKLTTDNKWTKIATLTASDAGKHCQFGSRVAIHGNSIVIFSREFNDEGISRGKLYVYEKSDGEEWMSATEDYIITKPFGTSLVQGGFGAFELHDNELVAIGTGQGETHIEVYTKSGGVFLLSQAIDVPLSNSGYSNFEWSLAVGDDFIAIATEQIENADHSNGAAFVYEKSGTYNTTPAILKSSEQTSSSWRGFGIAIAAYNSTLFVQGLKPHDNSYDQSFYIFEKPSGGWIHATQPLMLEAPGYAIYDVQLVANENYFFCAALGHESIIGFKKSLGEWSSSATPFTLDDLPSDKSLIGSQIKLNDNHLVVGCPARFLSTGIGEELIADYYSATGAWETEGLTHQQVIRETNINATNDFFGEAFGVYNDQLAITSTGDDEQGIDAGVVYLFDTKKQSSVPDQKVYNPEDENYTGFGESLAMGDSLMFIGAPYKDSVGGDGIVKYFNIGKVYVYRLTPSGWNYSSQIKGPIIQSDVSFGQQVVWSPGYCAVTEFYGGSSESIGRVHIYKENETNGKFEYIATLDPSTHLRSDFFGQSMVMTDSLMVIGTGNAAPNSSYRMSVYVFKKKGEWKNANEDARLVSTDSGWSDRFGASVSMYGDYIVVGAPYSPGFDPRPIPRSYIIPGAVYVYKRPQGGWKGTLTEIAKLTPRDPSEFGTFGTSVAIDHNDIYIGSPNVYRQYNSSDKFTNNDNTLIPGKVYHYTMPAGGWVTTNQENRQLYSFEPEIVDGYGATMYVSDRYLYVGAMLDDTPSGFRTGSVQTMMQLPIIDAAPILCSNQPPTKLFGFPKNGQWSGPGVHSTTGIFSPAVAGAGVHTIMYAHPGCETTVQIEVLPNELTISEQSDALQTKCIGKNIPIAFESDGDPENYAWYFKATLNDQFSKIDSLKETIMANKTGYYQVKVDRAVCTPRIREFRIIDESPVLIQIDPVSSICDDSEVRLSATPAAGQWKGPGITTDGKLNPINLQDGSYKAIYEVVTQIGCHWKDSVMVQVDKLKQPAIQSNGMEICGDRPVTLTVANVDDRTSIKWYNTDGSEIPEQSKLTLTAVEAGTYFATAFKGVCSFRTTPIQLIAIVDSLFVPNVFTANEDKVNDYFEIRSKGIDNFHLFVFNRYGQTMLETKDPNFKWSAENVPSGVYFWIITYTACSTTRKEEKGWVHVIK